MFVIGVENFLGYKEKGGTSIDNGINILLDHVRRGTYAVRATGNAPKALTIIDGHIGDASGVFSGVNRAEIVGTWLVVIKICSKKRGGQRWFNVSEEGLLRVRRDCKNNQ